MLSVTRAPKPLPSTKASTILLIESIIFAAAAFPACTIHLGIQNFHFVPV